MAAFETALPLRIGTRTLLTLRRRLVRHRIPLGQALEQKLPALPPLEASADGFLLSGLPSSLLPITAAEYPDLRPFVRQSYERRYVMLEGSFDAYLADFSSKSRSSLLRKVRKLARENGGLLDVRCCPGELDAEHYYRQARAVSATTYQERRLGAGFPQGPKALAEVQERASSDRMRGWLLFLGGKPIAYLYAPVEEDTLIYAYLGYDPAFAGFSPGAVLQFEAMRRLFAEGKFRLFDFTEGDGQHKRQFATNHVECADLLLVRPSLANIVAFSAYDMFDRTASVAKRTLLALGGERALQGIRR